MRNHIANKIEAKDKSLSKILNDERFKIDVFQREYRWRRKHIEDLISDLAISFLSNYKIGDGLDKYDSYDSYYMGPIVLCENNGSLSIVDGQQRLTSFTLLLLYLNHLQNSLGIAKESQKDLNKYLYVTKGGKTTLILDIDTRESIIKHLYENPTEIFEGDLEDESVRNIIDRYEDITNLFPEDIKNADVLPVFIEWLIFKVVLVEVRAFSMENAYTIFETMNDRGLNLSPTEMLKGYLLSKVEDDDKSYELNELWKSRINSIRATVGSDGDLDFFRAWLRAKYAETIRPTKQGATNEDFETIGTQFHAWVRSNSPEKTGLSSPDDHFFFLQSDFDYYSSLYEQIYNYRKHNNEEQNELYISNFYSIADSLSYPLYLSPLTKLDDNKTIQQKIKMVGKYLDIYTNLRILSGKAITQSSIRYSMYELVKSIRNVNTDMLLNIFESEIQKSIDKESEVFSPLHVMDNWGYFHYFFARILYTFLKEKDESKINFIDLMRSRKRNSLVLYRFVNEGEPDNGIEPQLWENYIGSVPAFCLVRRNELDYLYQLNQCDRIKYLIENGFMPELGVYDLSLIRPNHITEFISNRGVIISSLIREIWSI